MQTILALDISTTSTGYAIFQEKKLVDYGNIIQILFIQRNQNLHLLKIT